MENLFLAILTLGAIYYIYNTTFKNMDCKCNNKQCKKKKTNEI